VALELVDWHVPTPPVATGGTCRILP
jgi:hypothetical protein